MNISLQQKLGGFALMAVLAVGTLPLAGCPQQTTIAALVLTLGNAAASVAAIEGNDALSQKLQADTAKAETQILAWKPGTNGQMAVEALQLVQDDLALFPQVGPYAPLIQLAIGTTISIIEIIDPGAVPTALSKPHAVHLAKPPRNKGQFRKAWNDYVNSHPESARAYLP
jgi:hypothetical protein